MERPIFDSNRVDTLVDHNQSASKKIDTRVEQISTWEKDNFLACFFLDTDTENVKL